MELTQGKFADVVLSTSESMWCRVLKGERHWRYPDAKRVAEILGTDPALWMDSGASPLERRKAFEDFLEAKGMVLAK